MKEATNLCCVKCSSVLDKAEFQGLEVDLCPSCGGLWLDRGEIVRASKLPETELSRLRALLSGSKGPPPLPTATKTPCPACVGQLSEVVLGSVHVEYCAACHGIFLDRGELQAAVDVIRAQNVRLTAKEIMVAAVSATQPAVKA